MEGLPGRAKRGIRPMIGAFRLLYALETADRLSNNAVRFAVANAKPNQRVNAALLACEILFIIRRLDRVNR